jgi:hypothetical protein
VFLLQPRREQGRDLSTAPWAFESRLHAFVLDHEESRGLADKEAPGKVGVALALDPANREGVVVAPALQDLSEVALRPPRPAR